MTAPESPTPSITVWPAATGTNASGFFRFGAIAFLIEAVVLTVVGASQHWMLHPKPNSLDTTKFIETEMVQVPDEKPALTEDKPVAAPVHERVLSKVPQQGREAKPDDKKIEDTNQTSGRTALGPTHGPVAVFSPAPTIPSYLQNEDIHANVVIDFYVTALGEVVPKLVSSSGNEELDAIAVSTAKRWQFRPAEKDHQPIAAKVRLRILFEVH